MLQARNARKFSVNEFISQFTWKFIVFFSFSLFLSHLYRFDCEKFEFCITETRYSQSQVSMNLKVSLEYQSIWINFLWITSRYLQCFRIIWYSNESEWWASVHPRSNSISTLNYYFVVVDSNAKIQWKLFTFYVTS